MPARAFTMVWRTLSICPVCLGWVHLVADPFLADRPASPLPHARIDSHPNGWGEECFMVHRAAPPWDEPTTRAAVHGRSMGVCEFCQAARATDMHHRISRGVGGKWHPANIVHLCRACHEKATKYRDWAYLVGLVVLSHEDPAAKPIERPSGVGVGRGIPRPVDLLYLTDEVTGGLDDDHRQRTKRRYP